MVIDLGFEGGDLGFELGLRVERIAHEQGRLLTLLVKFENLISVFHCLAGALSNRGLTGTFGLVDFAFGSCGWKLKKYKRFES